MGNGDVTEFVMVDDMWEIIKQEKSGDILYTYRLLFDISLCLYFVNVAKNCLRFSNLNPKHFFNSGFFWIKKIIFRYLSGSKKIG